MVRSTDDDNKKSKPKSSSSGGVVGFFKRRKEKWQEAGGEFYQERYPLDQDQQGPSAGASTSDAVKVTVDPPQPPLPPKPTRPHIPLPSQTVRRGSLMSSTTRNMMNNMNMNNTRHRNNTNTNNKNNFYGNQSTMGNGNTMTYTSTMGRIMEEDYDEDVRVALMSDMDEDETIPDEKSTYKALILLRDFPQSIGEKRVRKARLGNIPQRRLTGLKRLKWEMQKGWRHWKRYWQHDLPRWTMFGKSIKKIEIHAGTSVADVFHFIKYTTLYNLFIFLTYLTFVITFVTVFALSDWSFFTSMESDCPEPARFSQGSSNASQGWEYSNENETQRLGCCSLMYFMDAQMKPRGAILDLKRRLIGQRSIENNPFFFGWYMHKKAFQDYDPFAVGYALIIALFLLLNLSLMMKSVGIGVKDAILSFEGDHNYFSKIVFAGWEHFTRKQKQADFKRKTILEEMKSVLALEKSLIEAAYRSRKEAVKLFVIRVFVNFVILSLAGASLYVIYLASTYNIDGTKLGQETQGQSIHDEEGSVLFARVSYSFVPALVITVFNTAFPSVLTRLGKLERFSEHTSTGLVLIRSLIIRLLSIGVLAFSFYNQNYCDLKREDGSGKIETCIQCRKNEQSLLENGREFRETCWENEVSDVIYRLILMDMLFKVVMTFVIAPFRMLQKKHLKNKVSQGFGTMKFSIIRHNLDIIYIQTLSWLGMYFGPVIPLIVTFYCIALFYIKKHSLLHHCIMSPDTFRTSSTTVTFVAARILSMLFVSMGYVLVLGYMRPSRGCGPFRRYDTPWEAVSSWILSEDSKALSKIYEGVASPCISLPLLLALVLLGYYYYSIAHANRQLVTSLRHMLVLEGHDKQYLFARLNSLRRGSIGLNSAVPTPAHSNRDRAPKPPNNPLSNQTPSANGSKNRVSSGVLNPDRDATKS